MTSTSAVGTDLPIGYHAGQVPDWLHLLPAGSIRTIDGRGPYSVGDVGKLIASSMAIGKLVLDENHATDLAAPKGQSAPARGWIVELQSRGDGIWGRVEWTAEGKRIMAAREYRGVSPVIEHTKAGEVLRLHRASLTNTPNFAGLVTLHSQARTAFRAQLVERLGLDRSKATDEIIVAAALRALAAQPVAVAAILDKLPRERPLTAADFAVIDALGLDVRPYQQEKSRADPDLTSSMHSQRSDETLASIEHHVIRALGVDALAYLAERRCG